MINFKNISIAILTFFNDVLPRMCVFVGLYGAFSLTALYYFNGNNFGELFSLYLSLIGIGGALAGISFSYAGAYDNPQREEIRIIGEAYLYGTLNLVCALIVIWIVFTGKVNFTSQYLKPVFTFIFTLSFGFINLAAVSMYYGIQNTLNLIKPRFYSHFDWG